MATSQHTDEVEIAASVAHSQGQPPLEHATDNAAQQGASISFLDTSDTTIPKPERLSTGETLGTFFDYYVSIQSLILKYCHPQ